MTMQIEQSRAFWNRAASLESDEALAQLLDRGEMAAWREIYRMGATDVPLRSRIKRLILNVALPLPHFWLAALASLGEPIDWDAPLPNYFESTSL
jgi:hypothetical protein